MKKFSTAIVLVFAIIPAVVFSGGTNKSVVKSVMADGSSSGPTLDQTIGFINENMSQAQITISNKDSQWKVSNPNIYASMKKVYDYGSSKFLSFSGSGCNMKLSVKTRFEFTIMNDRENASDNDKYFDCRFDCNYDIEFNAGSMTDVKSSSSSINVNFKNPVSISNLAKSYCKPYYVFTIERRLCPDTDLSGPVKNFLSKEINISKSNAVPIQKALIHARNLCGGADAPPPLFQ